MIHTDNMHLMQMGKRYGDVNQEAGQEGLAQYPRPSTAQTEDQDFVLVKMNIRTKSAIGNGFPKSHRDFARPSTPSQRHEAAAKTISNGGDQARASAMAASNGFATVTVNLFSRSEEVGKNEDEENRHRDFDIKSEPDYEAEEDEHTRQKHSKEDDSTVKGEDTDEESDDESSESSYKTESSYNEPPQRLALPNIVLPCSKCGLVINVCRLPSHRAFHCALNILKFAHDYKPMNINALIKRRKLLIKRMQESSAQRGEKGFADRNLQKINTAFETLKADIEGTSDAYRILNKNLEVRVSGGRDLELRCTSAVGLCEESNAQWKHMEDAYSFQDDFLPNTPSCFLGIYDGYCGNVTAQKCAKHLHLLIQEELNEQIKNSELTKTHFAAAFRRAYARFQELLWINNDDEEHSRNRWSGCSALTGILTDTKCYLAHAGNVGGVLIRGDAVTKVLTSKHDLYNKKERDRVRKSSGVIVKTEKCALVNGALGVTRGLGNIGDREVRNCVINAPRFKCVNLMPSDQIVLAATSGLWKMFSFEEVANLVLRFLRQIKEAVRDRIVYGKRIPRVTDTGRLEDEHAEFVFKYSNCGDLFKEFLRPEPSKHVGRPNTSHLYNYLSFNELDEKDEAPTVRTALDVGSWHGRTGRRLSDTRLQYKEGTPGETSDNHTDIIPTTISRTTYRRHSLPHTAGLNKLHTALGNNLGLTPKDKERLLAKSLAERLVKSTLLAGSLDNITVCIVLLPGFSLVNIHTLRPDLIESLDRPIDEEEW